jgi:hypothetical protein
VSEPNSFLIVGRPSPSGGGSILSSQYFVQLPLAARPLLGAPFESVHSMPVIFRLPDAHAVFSLAAKRALSPRMSFGGVEEGGASAACQHSK